MPARSSNSACQSAQIIGFTVSIFIAGLSYPGSDLLTEEAKIAILLASVIAAVVGVALLLAATRGREHADDLAEPDPEVEVV